MENDFRLRFEVARYVSVQIWNSAGKSLKTSIKDAKEAFPFPWEKKEIKVQTVEEMKIQLMAIADAFSSKSKKAKKK